MESWKQGSDRLQPILKIQAAEWSREAGGRQEALRRQRGNVEALLLQTGSRGAQGEEGRVPRSAKGVQNSPRLVALSQKLDIWVVSTFPVRAGAWLLRADQYAPDLLNSLLQRLR